MKGKREIVAAALGRDVESWVAERHHAGSSYPEIAAEVGRLTKVTVSDVTVRNWAHPEAARQLSRESVRRHRRRYGSKYESTGRNRAKERALRMFREEHPDVWQRLLDEECGRFRALSVAREGRPAS